MTRQHGHVKWFSNSKGYGFIVAETGQDIFVHHTSISGEGYKTLVEGERVEFEVFESDRGLKAQNVVRIEGGKSDSPPPD